MLNSKHSVILIAHNLRSCHNVGSLFRTAEGLGIDKIFLTGYTPYPIAKQDERMPHIAAKVYKQINKTALGADKTLAWQHATDIRTVIDKLKSHKYKIVALEQTTASLNIHNWNVPAKTALVLGRETEGIELNVLQLCDQAIEIPMLGKKESFNVVQAAAMAMFYCTFSK